MIGRMVWGSVRQRSGRSALLLGGYALGVGVTIVLLSVGHAMVDQAQDRRLLGGGDLIVLPEGIDLETLRTGGASSMYFAVDQARLLHREVLGGSRFDDRIAAAAPWIEDELVYLETDSGLVPASAAGTIPGLAASLGAAPDLVEGGWADVDADRRWRDPTAFELYASLDAMHLPAGAAAADTTWAEWHYFNMLLPDSGWLYLTYMVAGDVPAGRWGGRMLATRVTPTGVDRAYSANFDPADVAFAEGRPELAIGASSVTLEADGAYRLVARIPGSEADAGLSVDLLVREGGRRYLPPVEIGGADFASGYTVPLLDGRATGRVCEGRRCVDLDGAQAYHDHNWGTWSRVTWDWGQATLGRYSVLYGGVARGGPETEGAAEERLDAPGVDPAEPQRAGSFLYLADEHGFAGVFSIREIATRWPGAPGLGSPSDILVRAVNGADSLALRVTVGHARATSVPVAAAAGSALFHQMRGTARLTGRLGGAEVEAAGEGFFETWTRGRPQ